jgi:hypothetical protein
MKVLLNFIPNPSHQDENIEEKVDKYLNSLYKILKKDYKTKEIRNQAVIAISERKTFSYKIDRHYGNIKVEYSDSDESSTKKPLGDNESKSYVKPNSLDSSDESSSEDELFDKKSNLQIFDNSESSDSEQSFKKEDSSDESILGEENKKISLESDSSSENSSGESTPVEENKKISLESDSSSEESLNEHKILEEEIETESTIELLSDREKKLRNELIKIEEEKKKLQKKNSILSGGNLYYSSDEDKSNVSDFSNESYQKTYLIDSDSEEETFIDNSKKMKNRNYLNNLTVSELKTIMKTNNIKVTNNGYYLKKKDMVKNIIKNFK